MHAEADLRADAHVDSRAPAMTDIASAAQALPLGSANAGAVHAPACGR